jgi:hypothetical protein
LVSSRYWQVNHKRATRRVEALTSQMTEDRRPRCKTLHLFTLSGRGPQTTPPSSKHSISTEDCLQGSASYSSTVKPIPKPQGNRRPQESLLQKTWPAHSNNNNNTHHGPEGPNCPFSAPGGAIPSPCQLRGVLQSCAARQMYYTVQMN